MKIGWMFMMVVGVLWFPAMASAAEPAPFVVTISIQEHAPTPAPYNRVRADLASEEAGSSIVVPSSDTLHVLYLITEEMETEGRPLRVILTSPTPVTLTQSFPIGLRRNTSLTLDPTITIDGTHTSPMLTNIKERHLTPFSIPGYRPYDQNSHILIEGGIWDSNRHENPVSSQGFTFGNASDITVRNLTIKDIAGGHGVDAAGVDGLTIEGVQFLGHALTGTETDRDYNEAIQLDHMASSGPFGGTGTSWGFFDGSVTRNVLIRGNVFGASGSPGTIPWQVGIGSHSVVKGVPYESIRITSNAFYSMSNSGIRLTNVKGVTIDHNDFRKTGTGIKLYSSTYAFDPTGVNQSVTVPSINDSLLIAHNRFRFIPGYATHVNSVGYGGSGNGKTTGIHLMNNAYLDTPLTRSYFQHHAFGSRLSEDHYDITGTVLTEQEASLSLLDLASKGWDATSSPVFSSQLYQVDLPTRFTSKKVADHTAYLIRKGTGTKATVTAEKGGRYHVVAGPVIGVSTARQVESFIEQCMTYTYPATVRLVDHPNNLYRVGVAKRFTTYGKAQEAVTLFKKKANASAVIIREAENRYYVRTSSVLGSKRAASIQLSMKQAGHPTAFAYNTGLLRYVTITVHPFYGKTYANQQALYLKGQYDWLASTPVYKRNE